MNRQTAMLGALGAALVVALWWLFLYSPGQEELARIEEEVAAAEAETVSLQQRVAVLEATRARAPETEASIAQLRGIVPDDPALPGALRQIAAAADDAGVVIDALATARPTVADDVLGLYQSAVTMTASGSYFQLVDFLRRLEDPAITSRGFMFENLTVATAEYPTLTITLAGQMFATLEAAPVPAEVTDGEGATTPDTPGTEPTAPETEGDAVGVEEESP